MVRKVAMCETLWLGAHDNEPLEICPSPGVSPAGPIGVVCCLYVGYIAYGQELKGCRDHPGPGGLIRLDRLV